MAHYFGNCHVISQDILQIICSKVLQKSQMLQLPDHRDGHFTSEPTLSISEMKRGKSAKTPGLPMVTMGISEHSEQHLTTYMFWSDRLKSYFNLKVFFFFKLRQKWPWKWRLFILYSQITSIILNHFFQIFTSEDSHSLGLLRLRKDRREGQHHIKLVLL